MDRIVVKNPSTVFIFKDMRAAGNRPCGDCSACCKTLAVLFENGFKKPAGKWCEHWSKKTRCSIYKDRPSGCQNFQCEWKKGMGEDKHRPDRTKVVLDYTTDPNGPQGGILQMWEAAEGGLSSQFAREVARGAIASNILVSHIYLSGRKKLFIPTTRTSVIGTIEGAMNDGFEISPLRELEQ